MKKNQFFVLSLFFAASLLLGLNSNAQNVKSSDNKAGWLALFDGKTFNNFKGYNQEAVPEQWSIKDGALCFTPDEKAGHKAADLVTKEDFEDFDLSLEWKISKNGNSGILFNVVENPAWGAPYLSGPEMQVLDNDGHPDAKIPKHRAGDLYDLIKSSSEPVKAVGEWNHVRIVSKNAHYVFYLNEVKINEFTMHTAEWDKLVAGSKFKEWPQFAKAKKGKICLQAHGNEVCFRAIKIHKL